MKLINLFNILIPGLFCFLFIQQSQAQVSVQASIDSTMIMIGEQTTVRLNVVTAKDKQIVWPMITDTLTNGVMVLEKSKLDTLSADNNRIEIKQDFLITSFDSALYVLPPFKVISGADTLLSNPLVLKVVTFPEVDTEKGFFDIKGILLPEWVFSDYLLYIWIVLGTLFVLTAGIYAFSKRKKNQPIISFKAPKPKLPPHVEAITRLDKIKAEKIWQYGQYKEYYTQISDVLRTYILERFGVNAMEMTTEEILSYIYRLHEAHSTHDTLKKILELSDLVKFAKYVPITNDNELTILNAYLFVNQTKIEELPTKDSEETTNSESSNAKQELATEELKTNKL